MKLSYCPRHAVTMLTVILSIPLSGMSQTAAPAPSGGGSGKTTGSNVSGSSGTASQNTGAQTATTQSPTNTQRPPGTTQSPTNTQQTSTAQNPNQLQQNTGGNTNTTQTFSAQNANGTAQPNSTETSSGGTISTFQGDGFSFMNRNSGAPSNFVIGSGTIFTDSEGRIIPRDRFNSQTPATVYYSRNGDQMVATRVVAQAPAPQVTVVEAVAPFSAGTLTEVSPGVLVIEQPGASSTPVRYVNDKTTNYVDQNGEPVAPETVKAGTPVRVFYTKVGDTLVASKVEVQRGQSTGLPKPAIEAETITTTREIKR